MPQEAQQLGRCSSCGRTFAVRTDKKSGYEVQKLPPHRRTSGKKGLCLGTSKPVTTTRRTPLVER